MSGAARAPREEFLRRLAEEIAARKGDKPLKVAIDGRCGAGKTTFADELGRELRRLNFPILRPSVDGFHHPSEHRLRQGALSAEGYYQDAFDYERIVECLLAPLSGQEFPARCRLSSFDYRAELIDDSAPLLVERDTILLFDGVFPFRRELDAFWDFRILLVVDYEVSLSRALPRDSANGLGTAQEMERKYAFPVRARVANLRARGEPEPQGRGGHRQSRHRRPAPAFSVGELSLTEAVRRPNGRRVAFADRFRPLSVMAARLSAESHASQEFGQRVDQPAQTALL